MSLLNNTGLGKKVMIKKWLDKMGIDNYTINPDCTIDVDGGVDLSFKDLKELPIYIQFNLVDGYFDCSCNQLISLRGCPVRIMGWFDCSDNELETLEFSPKMVSHSYTCSDNKLKSLSNVKIWTGGTFFCQNNATELSINDIDQDFKAFSIIL